MINALLIAMFIIYGYVHLSVLSQISDVNYPKSFFLYACVINAISSYVFSYNHYIIGIVAFFIFLSLVEKQDKVTALFNSLYITFTVVIIEEIGSTITNSIINYTLDMQDTYSVIITAIIISIFIDLSIPPLHKKIYNRLHISKIDTEAFPDVIRDKIYKPSIYILLFGLIVIWLSYYYDVNILKRESGLLSPAIYFMILLAVFTYIIVLLFIDSRAHIYEREIEKIRQEQQIKDMDNYISDIEAINQTVRRYRHDMGNILLSLRDAIDDEDMTEIKEIYTNVIEKARVKLASSQGTTQSLEEIKIKSLKSLIANKVFTAQQAGINITCSLIEPIDEIFIEEIDYIRIVSILLDNAIDAAQTAENPYITLSLVYKFEDEGLELNVENNFKKGYVASDYINDLYKDGVTSHTDKKGRGVGLSNISLMKNKYGPNRINVETNSDETTFTQTITTYPYY